MIDEIGIGSNTTKDVKSIIRKYGKWDSRIRNGKWESIKVISEKSLKRMIKELEELNVSCKGS